MKLSVVLGTVLSIVLFWYVSEQSEAMAVCQQTHSYGTCLHAIK